MRVGDYVRIGTGRDVMPALRDRTGIIFRDGPTYDTFWVMLDDDGGGPCWIYNKDLVSRPREPDWEV